MIMTIVYLAFRRCVMKSGWLPTFGSDSFKPQLGEFMCKGDQGTIIIDTFYSEKETLQLHFTSNSKVYITDYTLIFDSEHCIENTSLALDSFKE